MSSKNVISALERLVPLGATLREDSPGMYSIAELNNDRRTLSFHAYENDLVSCAESFESGHDWGVDKECHNYCIRVRRYFKDEFVGTLFTDDDFHHLIISLQKDKDIYRDRREFSTRFIGGLTKLLDSTPDDFKPEKRIEFKAASRMVLSTI